MIVVVVVVVLSALDVVEGWKKQKWKQKGEDDKARVSCEDEEQE